MPGRRRGGSSTSGRLGKKAPAITAEWGPVSTTVDEDRRGWRTIRLRHASFCQGCGTELPVGTRAEWKPGAGVRHVGACP